MAVRRPVSIGACIFIGALAFSCSSKPESTSAPASAEGEALTPVLSIRELMTHIIDPTADWIFDAAVVDVSAVGSSTTLPTADEDWLKVERGLLTLAEASNLLKMHRPVAPAGAVEQHEPGKPSPELSPAEIQAKIDQDRPRWNRHADNLRTIALAQLAVVKARNAEGLFKAGGDIDNACESCHLEFWYPGDREAVKKSQDSKVTFDPPKK